MGHSWIVIQHHENLFNNFKPLVLKRIYCLSQSEDKGNRTAKKSPVWTDELAPFSTWG